MNIVFMGSPDFAIPSLNILSESHHTVRAVVSNVDKRRGRGSKKYPTPVKARAQELNLPVIEVDDLHDPTFAEKLAVFEPDLLVVVAFRILPPAILSIPKRGSVNLHASLLPRYRGAAPIHRAVMNGETETGCTIFFLDEQVDTGRIILQKKVPIGPNETTGEVYHKLMITGSKVLLRAVNSIEEETFSALDQDDSQATPAPKIFREDAHIDFHQPAVRVHNMIRGLSPFPGAWATLDGEKFNMYRSEPAFHSHLKAGELFTDNGELFAGCSDRSVKLLEIQLPGKKRMLATEFLKGNELSGILH